MCWHQRAERFKFENEIRVSRRDEFVVDRFGTVTEVA